MTQSYLRNIILLKKRGENMFDVLFVNALRVSIFIIERNYLLEFKANEKGGVGKICVFPPEILSVIFINNLTNTFAYFTSKLSDPMYG